MSRMLLGLLPAVACARGPVAYPLCDGEGAPACGNIGQTGRAAVPQRIAPRASRADDGVKPRGTNSLLAAGVNAGAVVARPLLDAHARPAPGNCVGKCGGGGDDDSVEVVVGKPIEVAAVAAPAHATASRIVALAGGALVIDEDSGMLIRTGADERNTGYVEIGRGAGTLAYDPASRLAYVADRGGDRIVVVRVGAELAIERAWTTAVEPYGVALAPDRRTLLVTAVADRALIAYDAATGVERWRVTTSVEPRGVAISPDGKHAIVASLASGGVDRVDLAARRLASVPIALPRPPRGSQSFARAAFAVTYLGDDLAVVPFQRETPVPLEGPSASQRYGGGRGPIAPELAFVRAGSQVRVQMPAHLPRALAFDAARDVLYVAGMGTDMLQPIHDATTATVAGGRRIPLTTGGEPRCGPDGVAVAADGDVLVWCAFTRKVTRLDFAMRESKQGPQLIGSALAEQQHAGMVMFHASDPMLSARGELACATCHPEGRSDGLSWAVTSQLRQTPVLAGRVVGTHPFKWDGTLPTLRASVAGTMDNLGGRRADAKTVDSLVAYLEGLPALAAPRRDAAAVARGRRVFDASGCSDCHEGARYTDGKQHELRGGLPSDTPSLHGVAASAPYYHDGSAPTLAAVVGGHGRVHMTDARVTGSDAADLVAFLETL